MELGILYVERKSDDDYDDLFYSIYTNAVVRYKKQQ